MNLVVLMAGNGSRFAQVGFTDPKPLIKIKYKNSIIPMYQAVIDNLKPLYNPDNIVVITRKDIASQFTESDIEFNKNNNIKEVYLDKITGGALETALYSEPEIDMEKGLILANCDQLIEINKTNFKIFLQETGSKFNHVLTFNPDDNSSKWSFVKIDDQNNQIIELAEKVKISNEATVGIYYFYHSETFFHNAKQMIKENDKVNNEFYVSPIFNRLSNVYPYYVDKMIGLGTPEDLNIYLKNT